MGLEWDDVPNYWCRGVGDYWHVLYPDPAGPGVNKYTLEEFWNVHAGSTDVFITWEQPDGPIVG